MKNIFSKVMCLVSLLTMTSCELSFGSSNKDSSSSLDSSNEITSSSNITSSSDKNNIEIPTPVLKLNEDNGVVTWDAIENAEFYHYIINDETIRTTTGTTLELKDKTNVSVQAVVNKSYSNWSNAVTYYNTDDVFVEMEDKYHSVFFHDTDYEVVKVKEGEKVTKPINPSKPNHRFENWYSDPFYQTLFDFNMPILQSTVIYAKYTPIDLVNNVRYWIKADAKLTADVQSNYTSSTGWRFTPLKEVTNSTVKEFSAIVNINGATTTAPCSFIIMDGLDDNPGRTYYKNGANDFTISEDGTYRITFSVETLYLLNGSQVNAKIEKISSISPSYAGNYGIELKTPVVEVDSANNIAFISEVENSTHYEVIINNGTIFKTTDNHLTLNAKEHISVRAVNNTMYSGWSIPQANVTYIYEEDIVNPKTHAYVYFYESNQNAKKVAINSYVEEEIISKEGHKFLGWYLDLACSKKANFPYLVTENTVFYPKWEYNGNFLTKEYYGLYNSSNTKIAGLVINEDNYDFYEYEAKGIYLSFGEQYYVKSLTTGKVYGPYTVSESGTYNIYFSEDHIWNVNTDKASNIYFASVNRTIYFSNSKRWTDTIYAYVWSSSSNEWAKSWPGSEMTYLETNSYGEQIYTIDIDVSKYDMLIISHGTNGTVVTQTVDISLTKYTNNGFYVTNKNSEGKYEIGTYSR